MVKTAILVNTQPTGLIAIPTETARVHRRTAITTDWITTTMNTTWTWRRTEMINLRKMIRSQSLESGMLWRALRRLAKQDFCKNSHPQSSSWWFSCSLMFFKVDFVFSFHHFSSESSSNSRLLLHIFCERHHDDRKAFSHQISVDCTAAKLQWNRTNRHQLIAYLFCRTGASTEVDCMRNVFVFHCRFRICLTPLYIWVSIVQSWYGGDKTT